MQSKEIMNRILDKVLNETATKGEIAHLQNELYDFITRFTAKEMKNMGVAIGVQVNEAYGEAFNLATTEMKDAFKKALINEITKSRNSSMENIIDPINEAYAKAVSHEHINEKLLRINSSSEIDDIAYDVLNVLRRSVLKHLSNKQSKLMKQLEKEITDADIDEGKVYNAMMAFIKDDTRASLEELYNIYVGE